MAYHNTAITAQSQPQPQQDDQRPPSSPFEDVYSLPVSNSTLPTDRSLYQTPKQSLTSLRFIINLVVGAVFGWVINYLIALFTTRNSDRAALWRFVDDFNQEFPDGTSQFVIMYGSPIWIDFLASGLLTGFIGGFLGNFTLRWEVEHAKKKPILSEHVDNSPVFKALGCTVPNMALRSLIMAIWGTAVTFPLAMILFSISCGAGGMHEMLIPPEFETYECYLTRGWFCLIKGFYCVVITTIIGPLIEVGGLNVFHLTKKNLERYFKRKNDANEKNQPHSDDATAIQMMVAPSSDR